MEEKEKKTGHEFGKGVLVGSLIGLGLAGIIGTCVALLSDDDCCIEEDDSADETEAQETGTEETSGDETEAENSSESVTEE